MNPTVETSNSDRQERGNIFCGLFIGIIDGFAKLCSCTGSSSSSSLSGDRQVLRQSTRRSGTDFVNVNIGGEFVRNVSEPVIETPPVARGKQQHAVYVESIFQQQKAHKQIVADLIKEDEEFARRLQDGENKYEAAKASAAWKIPGNFAKESSLNKRLELPGIHGKTIEDSLPPVQRKERPHSEEFDSSDETDLAFVAFDQPAAFYREQAQQHFKKRNQYYRNAKQCLKVQNHQLANHYYQLAREQIKLIEEANNRAAAAFLAENSGRNPRKNTIDLHHLYVREAIQALDDFLDDEILSLRDEHLKTKSLIVITGRGKHSPDGVPKIKPAVIERLEVRKLKYSVINPGSLRVHILKESYLTNDLS